MTEKLCLNCGHERDIHTQDGTGCCFKKRGTDLFCGCGGWKE